MRAAVTKDRMVRTIVIEVADVPDIDVTASYHRKPRIFRPGTATLKIVDGDLISVRVIGGLVLKSGKASTQITEEIVYENNWGVRISDAPGWVKELALDAPQNVTTWRTGVEAGEVQAL